ncbi:hypothetical protein B9479_003012 [Cryptococcus floricola]|uniref:Uncharacterized protein n=1 Tax=Cryptococcus floricola TaxID=2591691 RepID=A0A5D3B1Z6_9TREE|nr:hypothetical protein B9479_003012 [Cryptococcus floricola]
MPYSTPTRRRPSASVNLEITPSTSELGSHAASSTSSNKENEPSLSFNMGFHRPPTIGFAAVQPFVPMDSPWRDGVQSGPTKTIFKVQTSLPSILAKRHPLGLYQQSPQAYGSPPRPAPSSSTSPTKPQPYSTSKLSRIPSLIPGSPIRSPPATASAESPSDQRRGLGSMDERADRLESTGHLELADSLRMTTVESGEKVGRPWYDESLEVGALADESAVPSASCSEAACTLEYSTSVLPEDLDFFSPQIDEDTSPPCRELSYSNFMPYLTPLPDESTGGPFTESSTEQSEEVEELQGSTELSSTDSIEQLSGSRDLSFGSTAMEESDQSSFHSQGHAGGMGKGLVTESILSFDALVERECVSMDEGGITGDSIIAPSTEDHGPETTRETSQVLTERSSSIDMGSSEDAFGDKADIPIAESPPSPSPKIEVHTEQDAALSADIATADMTRNMTPSPPAVVPPPEPLTPTQASRASRATADGDLSELISKKTVLYATPAYQYEPFEVGDSVSEEDKTIDTIQQDAPIQESASAETNGEQSTKSSDFTDVVLAQEKVDVVPAPVDSDENQAEEERQPITITIRMPRGEDYVNLHNTVVEPCFQPPDVPSPIRHTISKSETLLSVPGAKKLHSKGNEESRPTIAFISPSTSYYAEDFGGSSGHVVHPTAAERFATEAGRKARGGRSAAEHVVYTFHQKKQRSPSSPSGDRVVQLPDPVRPARRDEYVLEQKSTIRWLWFCLLTGFFFPFNWLVGGWLVGNNQLREWYKDDGDDMADRQAVKDEAERKDAANFAPLAGSQQVVLQSVAGQTPAPGRLYQCRRVPSVLNACTSCHQPSSMAVPRITTHPETHDMPASDTRKGQVGEASTSCTSTKDVTSSGGDELEPGHFHSVLACSADQQSDSLALPTHRAIRHKESHSTLASTSSTVMTAPSARSTDTFCPRGLSPEPGGSSSVSSPASERPPQQVQSAPPDSVKGSEQRGGDGAHHPSGDEDKTDGGSRFYSPGCGTPLTTVPSTHNPQVSHHALADAAAKLPANFTSASAHGVDKETGEDPGWTREAGIKRVKKLRRVNKVAALVGFSLYIGIAIGLGIGFTHHAS